MKVTLEEVAARAGVSLATVSRVLGRRDAVAAATRTKVLEAMNELGYSRSTLLHDAPRRLVAVSAPGNPEHWQVQVCTRVAKALQDHDLLVTRPLVETDPEPLRVAIDAGAVALVTPTLTSLHTEIPCIRVDEQSASAVTTPARTASRARQCRPHRRPARPRRRDDHRVRTSAVRSGTGGSG
jgi:AcrR family transcriptional regulator